ncbi:hypothetical protein [Gimesia maris]|uniref:hypothetical protein n=1 Tax=Gimesia maris TaxID=122 RepID=UPI0032EC2A31
MWVDLPLNDKEKGQLRQIENRHEVLESDVQDVAGMLLKVVEWIESQGKENG